MHLKGFSRTTHFAIRNTNDFLALSYSVPLSHPARLRLPARQPASPNCPSSPSKECC